MTHEQYREQLSALLDGEADDAARETALSHLADCADCRAYLAEIASLHDLLGGLDDLEPPAGFADNASAELHGGKTSRRVTRRGWTVLAACAAAVLIAVCTLPRMGGAPETAPAPSAADTGRASGIVTDAAPTETEEEDAVESKTLYGGTAPADMPEAEIVVDAATEAKPSHNEASTDRSGAPPLTLCGEGAADWLAEHGEPADGNTWRVTVEDVNALPETLVLTGLQKPADGVLFITLDTTEETQ